MSERVPPAPPFPGARNRAGRKGSTLRWQALALLLWLGWPVASRATTDARVVERYRQMLSANPREGTVLERLWKVAAEEGKTEAWLAQYTKAGEQGDFAAQMISGLFLRRLGREAQAQEAFGKAAILRPDSPLPLQAMADGLPPAEKAATLEKALSLLPKGDASRTETLQALGDAWIGAGEPRKAAQAWEEMLTASSAPHALRARLAGLYARNGMPAQALRHYRILEEEGEPAERTNAYRAHARLMEQEGDAPKALELLGQALDLIAPGHWLYGEVAGEIIQMAERTGQKEALAGRWRSAAEAGNPQALPLLAMMQEREGDSAGLRATLEAMATRAPDDLAVRIRLARLSRREGAMEEAARRLDEVLAAKPPHREELVLERAALDIAAGDPAAARKRLEAELPDTEPWEARRIAFYEEHRMYEALEARLRRPGADPVELAEFLFERKRPREAQDALQQLVHPGEGEAARAQAFLKIAGLLRQHQENAGAIAALQAAMALQPRDAAYPKALGELYLTEKRFAQAREALLAAYALAATPEARMDTDRQLFQSFEQAGTPPVPAESTGADATHALATLFSAPVSANATPSRSAELLGFIEALGRDASPEGQLRQARWLFWNHDFNQAQKTLAALLEHTPENLPAQELALAIARASNDHDASLKLARLLAERVPAQRTRYLRESAQILLAQGDNDGALAVLTALSEGGDAAALTDLANAQQQAQRWYDALATWQRLYRSAPTPRRAEILPSLARAMQQLGMHESLRELLWEALEEQDGNAGVLQDLIAAVQSQHQFPWLEEKLRTPPAPGQAAKPWRVQALVQVLTAQGRHREAYETLREAAQGAPDRAAAQAGLVAMCEKQADFAAAAQHQRLRLRFLAEPDVEEWTRLATLEAAALHDDAAEAAWEEIILRFPGKTDALLSAARYLEPVAHSRALEIARQAFRGEPESVPAALLLLRWSDQPAETAAAAEQILKVIPASGDKLILPPAPASIGNQLRALFSVLGGEDSPAADPMAPTTAEFFHERMPGRSEPYWRLEAIRALAGQVRPEGRAAWMARWQGALPSEWLWAAFYSGADAEVPARLLTLASRPQADNRMQAALVWELLRKERWEELSRWLWAPERLPDQHEIFRRVLQEWALLNRPVPVETLVANAPGTWLEPIARALAQRNRFTEAVTVGKRIAPADGRSGFDYLLAQWMIGTGEQREALELLRTIAAQPADGPDSPTYAAQRALYLFFSEPERGRWRAEVEAAQAGSPLHSALTRALLAALAGEQEPMKSALDEVLQLHPLAEGSGEVAERVWHYRMILGARLAAWDLDQAARYFWEKALEDGAAVAAEGKQSASFSREISMRLLVLQLADQEPAAARRTLEERMKSTPVESLTLLSTLLEDAGFDTLARVAYKEVWKRAGAQTSIASLIAAPQDSAFVDAAVATWEQQPETDLIASPVVLEYLAKKDRQRAIAAGRRLLALSPADQRVRELLASYETAQEEWGAAAENYRVLLEKQGTLPLYRVGLAQALFHLGKKQEALETLRETPRHGGEPDVQHALLLARLDQWPAAFRIGEDLARGSDSALLIRLTRALSEAGKKEQSLVLLIRAVEIAAESDRPRAAYSYQRAAIELAGPASPHALRWMTRLRQLADRPEFLSDWFEFAKGRLPVAARLDQMRRQWSAGSEIAGSWLAETLLESGAGKEAAALLPDLLRRGDMPTARLAALEQCYREHGLPLQAAEVSGLLYHRAMLDEQALLHHIRSLHQAGKRELAVSLLERGAALSVFQPAWCGRFAFLALELGEAPLARRLLERAVKADPAVDKPDVHIAWTRLLLREGNHAAAKRALRRLCASHTGDAAPVILEYLRASRRLAPQAVATELRDLALTPEQLARVQTLIEGENAATGKPGPIPPEKKP